MTIDLHAYQELYLKTARDLQTLATQLVKKISDGSQDEETLTTLHRTVHSLKSQSLVMGYRQIGLASKSLEDLFKYAKDHTEILHEEVLDEVSKLLIQIEEALADIENKKGEPDLSHCTKKTNHLIGQITQL